MNKLEVVVINENAVMCLNKGCPNFGRFDSCYLHTYLLQDCWIDFYQYLDDEQKEVLFHPEQFLIY